MRTFVAGVATGLVLSVLTAVTAVWFWPWQVNATATPGTLESQMMRRVLDRSVTRQAPRLSSPLPATNENLLEVDFDVDLAPAEFNGGTPTAHYKLTNASLRQEVNSETGAVGEPPNEVFQFTFQKIQTTIGTSTFSDDWSTGP